MHDGWIYQGRQYHMWFGHGTKPVDGSSAADAKPDLGSIDDWIHNLGHTLVAGLPASKRYHAAARLGADDHARLDRVMEGVVRALPLGPRVTALRVLGMHPDGRGVEAFVDAGRIVASAQTHADLREATDTLAASAQEMGLDNFKPFLRRADDHLTGTGGLLALLRDPPKPASHATPPPVIKPPVRPALPLPGQLAPLLRGVLRKAGLAGLALTALEALIEAHREAEIRAVIERFKLDPTKASDMAAALAYVWASHNRALLIVTPPGDGQLGTSLPESAQGTVAEQVMRAVQNDPTLLDRAMSGDAGALGTIRSIVQTVASGLAIETRNEEERQLVDRMVVEGKSGEEIQSALDELRTRAGGAMPLSRSRFGHTFDRHGQDATEFLRNRARATGIPNGQFMDNQAAARFIQENLGKTKGEPVSVPVPEGFPARVINPDGSFSPARTIRLVPGGRGVKTAFPEP